MAARFNPAQGAVPEGRPAVEQRGSRSRLAVEARGISMVFNRGDDDDFVALDQVDFSVGEGEFVSLVGPSGCGKSTLLRIVCGLLRPTQGEVSVYGEPLRDVRRDVALMFQEATLLQWRTVLSNTLLPVEILRKPTAADVGRAREILRMVHLEEFERNYPRELSGGMQQRVALSRVLMTEPRLMLLDEPFGALDEFTRERLNVELSQLVVRSGMSVVLVTHNISEAVFLADRVVAMGTRPGRVIEEFVVPLDRPRDTGVMRLPEFQDIVFNVRKALGVDG